MHAYRTHHCAALRAADAGSTARLSGWVHRKRDHGGLLFVDLRDHFGITQCVAAQGSPAFAALPTISEQGFAGFQMGDWLGLLAPVGTPAPVISRLFAAAKDAVEQPALAPRLEALGLTPAAEGPEAFARFLATERAEMRALIAVEGIKLD